ncbi:NADPH dehydrogenase afvA-like protein [Elsinoe fawcettii]|nr:NADPH dehydrogenase afvA-like protein [Elsinoe fawcettii]
MPSAHHAIESEVNGEPRLVNRAASNTKYFTPLQAPAAGTALVTSDTREVPKLFTPLRIRGLTLNNRITVAPMCQYSAEDGHFTMWHTTHLGGIVQRGPGITCVEATAVVPEGRISPEDVGLWKDSQIEGMRQVVDFAHSQGQYMMIQLGHAGRKASTVAPWLSSGDIAGPELNGWPDNVYGPSAIPWNEKHAMPKAMTLQDIQNFKGAFASSVRRALQAGFDAIEIHGAHGYLISEFLSPVSNHRTDKYGGSFEGRTRLAIELVEETRAIIPQDMPLFFRISATDWLEEVPEVTDSWTSDDTVRLAEILCTKGVDVLDVSTGGNHSLQQPHSGPGYQAPFAIKVKEAVGDRLLA